jgi:hypothetical protein
MIFSSQQIQFLQRLVKERPTERRAGEVSTHFSEHYSIGTVVGRQVEYRDEHLRIAEALRASADSRPSRKPDGAWGISCRSGSLRRDVRKGTELCASRRVNRREVRWLVQA